MGPDFEADYSRANFITDYSIPNIITNSDTNFITNSGTNPGPLFITDSKTHPSPHQEECVKAFETDPTPNSGTNFTTDSETHSAPHEKECVTEACKTDPAPHSATDCKTHPAPHSTTDYSCPNSGTDFTTDSETHFDPHKKECKAYKEEVSGFFRQHTRTEAVVLVLEESSDHHLL